jgi:hypothetical protein
MHDIIQSLTKKESVIETGTVDEYLGDGKYRIQMNGRKILVRSAVVRLFDNGVRVVINRIGDTYYIIGATGQLENKIEREIVIDA